MRFGSLIIPLLATALLLSERVAPRALASPAPLCSLAPFPHGRDPNVTYLVGVALADTMLAGPGRVRPSRGGGHWGPGRERTIYGQLVRVDTLAGARAEDLQHAFAQQGARQILIVPWDYDPGCEPTFWTGSARWVEPGLTGFFTVTPRSTDHWVHGVPTFDAFAADLEPYPHGAFFRAGYRGTEALRTSASLSPREFFEMYTVLPTWEESNRRDSTAFERASQWARDNSSLAIKYPASQILEYLERRRTRQF